MNPVLDTIAGDLDPDLGLSFSGDFLTFDASVKDKEGRRGSPLLEFLLLVDGSFLWLLTGTSFLDCNSLSLIISFLCEEGDDFNEFSLLDL
jgi:hypothetical protein